MAKSHEMVKLLNTLGQASGFKQSRQRAEATRSCVQCAKPATHFRDEISKREYEISFFCQSCQDDVFGSPDNRK